MSDLIPESFRTLLTDRPADPVGTTATPDRPDGATWLRRLPQIVADHLDTWNLTLDGDPRHGECALVLPVRRRIAPRRAVLKITWPHAEARHEHLALRAWDGHGAVRLLAADPASHTLLLERLDADRPLTAEPLLDACETIGGLMRTLDRPALPQLDTVADRARRWDQQLAATSSLVPRRLTEQARSTLTQLLADAPPPRLVHEDLHDANVLAQTDADHDPDRGGWLAIDPKPVAGEWAYAVAPVVWNRAAEAARAHSLRTHARLRADIVAEAAGLDEGRVHRWTFVRLVLNAVWAAEHAPSSDDFRSRMIALAKAFAG